MKKSTQYGKGLAGFLFGLILATGIIAGTLFFLNQGNQSIFKELTQPRQSEEPEILKPQDRAEKRPATDNSSNQADKEKAKTEKEVAEKEAKAKEAAEKETKAKEAAEETTKKAEEKAAQAEKGTQEKADREAKEKADKAEAGEAEHEAKEKAEKVAADKAEREAKERADKTIANKTEREAKEKAAKAEAEAAKKKLAEEKAELKKKRAEKAKAEKETADKTAKDKKAASQLTNKQKERAEHKLVEKRAAETKKQNKLTPEQILSSDSIERARKAANASATKESSSAAGRQSAEKVEAAANSSRKAFLQLDSYADRSNADPQRAKLTILGVSSKVAESQNGDKAIYRVQSNTIPQETVVKLQKNLQGRNISSLIRSTK